MMRSAHEHEHWRTHVHTPVLVAPAKCVGPSGRFGHSLENGGGDVGEAEKDAVCRLRQHRIVRRIQRRHLSELRVELRNVFVRGHLGAARKRYWREGSLRLHSLGSLASLYPCGTCLPPACPSVKRTACSILLSITSSSIVPIELETIIPQ